MRGAAPPRVGWTGEAYTAPPALRRRLRADQGITMNRIVWLIGAVVIVLFLLSFLGLR